MTTHSAAGCVFCAIVAGTSSASPVYDDARVLAFMDLNPVARGHLLVVPKRHAADLAELDPADGERVFAVAQRLAAALRSSAIPVEGVNLFLADGEVAGQEVFHVHLHVLARTPGDGFRITADFGHPERASLDADAAAVRSALGHI